MRLAAAFPGLRRAGRAALDLVAPPTCMGCDAPTADPHQLCAACFGRCHFITAPFCRSCGVPFAYAGQGGLAGRCPGCTTTAPPFGAARGALAYDEHSRALILRFKHAQQTELARLLAPMMARAGAALLREAELLVPVPLHRARLRQRGYNQAALLARALARAVPVPTCVDALRRVRRTAPMGHDGAAARREAMRGAIVARPDRAALIAGRRILLIDDVMTSGATIGACAEALLAAGAAGIDALVAARVPDPDLDRAG